MGFFNWAAPIFGRYANRWTAEDVAEIAGWLRPFVAAGGSLLDVGGGTGALAQRLHDALSADVTVLDPTPEMVRYLPADSPVHVVLGHAEAMPFSDGAFDGIIVSDAFHHFRQQGVALAEFSRVVRPGGGVLVLELDPGEFSTRVAALVERMVGEPAAFMHPDELARAMAEQGILGECTPLGRGSYRFTGSTADSAENAPT